MNATRKIRDKYVYFSYHPLLLDDFAKRKKTRDSVYAHLISQPVPRVTITATIADLLIYSFDDMSKFGKA